MPVTQSDILFHRSSAADSTGGAKSATAIVDGVKNNLWADLTDVERVAGGTRYRKLFVTNSDGVDSLLEPSLWYESLPTGFTHEIGLGFNDADDDSNDAGNMTAWSAAARVGLVSSAADTRQATIVGVDNSGNPVSEQVTLNGTTEVLSVATFSKVWAVKLSAESATLTVTVRQGAGGTTRGTVAVNRECCWLWVAAVSLATAILLPNLGPGLDYGVWVKQTWPAGVAAARPGSPALAVKET